nr:IPT/TIG domain-containing protein [uncultured Carboxylicivirga sp.]
MRYYSYIIISICFLLHSCQKDYQKSEAFVLSTKDVAYEGNTTNGVTFSASIVLESENEILEQGFVIDLEGQPTIDDEVLRVKEVSNKAYSLQYDNVLVPDTTYYVRSFLKTQKYIVYGNQVEFYSNGSQAPVISKIEPSVVFWLDTVLITGANFDKYGKKNIISFNGMNVPYVWFNKDSIKVIVPPSLNVKESYVTVSVYGNKSEGAEFQLQKPLVSGINKTEGQYPDTIMIQGENLSEFYGQLYWGEEILKPLKINPIQNPYLRRDRLYFRVPFMGDELDVDLKYYQVGDVSTVNQTFHYNEQKITGVSLDSMFLHDSITVYGKNIDFLKANFELLLGGQKCQVVDVWKDSVKVFFSGYYGQSEASEFEIEGIITDSKEKSIYKKSIKHRDPYVRVVGADNLTYMDELEIAVKGVLSYGNTKYYIYNDKDELILSNYYYGSEIKLSEDIIPGNYSLEIKCYSRTSNRVNFKVNRPIVTSFPNGSIKKGEVLRIEGAYLPRNSSFYRLRHLESNLTFERPWFGSEENINDYYTTNLIGKGQYQLEFVFGNEVYSTDNIFTLEDNFSYQISCDRIENEMVGKVCFAKDDKLYYLLRDEAAMRIIDINTGKVEKKHTNIRLADSYIPGSLYPEYCIFPTIIDDKIYITNNYRLVEFNFDSMDWDQVAVVADNDSVVRTANVNNQLVVNTKDNKILKYNGSWEEMGELNLDYYTWGIGDYLYTGFNNSFQKISLNNFDDYTSIISPFYRFGYYYAFRHLFIYNNELYECFNGNYNLEIARLSPTNDSFTKLDPSIISDDTILTRFFSDVNGDVYYLVNNVIYKFTPNE